MTPDALPDTETAPERPTGPVDAPAPSRGTEMPPERSPEDAVWIGLYGLSQAAKIKLPSDDAMLVGIAVGATIAMSSPERAKMAIATVIAAARVVGADPAKVSKTIVAFASAVLGNGTMEEPTDG